MLANRVCSLGAGRGCTSSRHRRRSAVPPDGNLLVSGPTTVASATRMALLGCIGTKLQIRKIHHWLGAPLRNRTVDLLHHSDAKQRPFVADKEHPHGIEPSSLARKRTPVSAAVNVSSRPINSWMYLAQSAISMSLTGKRTCHSSLSIISAVAPARTVISPSAARGRFTAVDHSLVRRMTLGCRWRFRSSVSSTTRPGMISCTLWAAGIPTMSCHGAVSKYSPSTRAEV